MNNPSHQATEPVKQRILETTLTAVKKRKQKQKTTRITATCAIIVFAVIAIMPFFRAQPTAIPQETASSPASTGTPHDTQDHLNYEVSMVKNGGITTKALSMKDLTEILFYHPELKFRATEHAYTWENRSMLIYVNRPAPILAITDPLSSLNL